MNKTLLKYFALGAAIVLFSMCKKNNDDDSSSRDTDVSSAFDHTYMDAVASDMDLIAQEAGDTDTTQSLSTLSPCVTITRQHADTSNKDTLLVDFGATNCTCGDGKARSGQLQFVYAPHHKFRDSGLVITCTPVNYHVDNSLISGTKYITNRGRNAAGNYLWNIIDNLTIYKSNNLGIFTWNATRVIELLNTPQICSADSLPVNWQQAKTGTTGTTSGVGSDGSAYQSSITTMLERDLSCAPDTAHIQKHPYIKGKLNFELVNKPTRTIDYGKGDCDRTVYIFLDGGTYYFSQ